MKLQPPRTSNSAWPRTTCPHCGRDVGYHPTTRELSHHLLPNDRNTACPRSGTKHAPGEQNTMPHHDHPNSIDLDCPDHTEVTALRLLRSQIEAARHRFTDDMTCERAQREWNAFIDDCDRDGFNTALDVVRILLPVAAAELVRNAAVRLGNPISDNPPTEAYIAAVEFLDAMMRDTRPETP